MDEKKTDQKWILRIRALSDCPFCGGEGMPASAPDGDWIQYTVMCRSCAAEGPWALTPEGAIENWSKRV